jgi:hypothetical protein
MADTHKLHKLDKSAVAEHNMETDHQAVSEHYSTTKISDYMDCLVRSHRKEATPDISNSIVKHGTPQKNHFQQEM